MFSAAVASTGTEGQIEYCRMLHERLTSRARQRVTLEAEEARDLVFAEEAGLHRQFGYVSMLEYMERELHYGPHAAKERLRVANELFELPELAAKLRSGDVPFSVVREVTRVAVPETQDVWLARIEGKTARDVERMVSGLAKGAMPDDRPHPKLVRHRVVLDLDDERHAKWLAMRTAREEECGAHLDDNQLVDSLAAQPSGDGTNRPIRHAVTTCRVCTQSTLVAGGIEVALDASTAERLQCDAMDIGDLESDDVARVKPAIPAATRRKVFIRDRFACVVPGCRARRNLDLHHIDPRSRGGSHAMSNLVTLCSGHHRLLHERQLVMRGRAPDRLVFELRRDDGEVHRVLGEDPSVPRGTGAGLNDRAADRTRVRTGTGPSQTEAARAPFDRRTPAAEA